MTRLIITLSVYCNVYMHSGSVCCRVAAHICMLALTTLWILLKYDTIIPAVITIDLGADGDASPVLPRQDTVRQSGEATEVIQPQFYGTVSSFTSS